MRKAACSSRNQRSEIQIVATSFIKSDHLGNEDLFRFLRLRQCRLFIVFPFWDGVEPRLLLLTNWPNYHPWMMLSVDQSVECLVWETQVLRENLSLCPQIPHCLTRSGTLAAAVGSRQLTASATARPFWNIAHYGLEEVHVRLEAMHFRHFQDLTALGTNPGHESSLPFPRKPQFPNSLVVSQYM
jgi:hypothetical protein